MSREEGISLVELLIAMFLMMIVSIVFYGTLSGTLAATARSSSALLNVTIPENEM